MRIYGVEVSPDRSHADVTGNWGGEKAWIVHYLVYGINNETQSDCMQIYRHVGNYWEVGNWPRDRGASKWEVVCRCVEFMDKECSIWKLAEAVFSYWFHKMRKPRWLHNAAMSESYGGRYEEQAG
jgi:hypothetical protein